MHNPNFAKLAEAAGLSGCGRRIPADVKPMIEQALAHPGPALVDVVVNRQELAMPPTIDVAQAVGFSLYMIQGGAQRPG